MSTSARPLRHQHEEPTGRTGDGAAHQDRARRRRCHCLRAQPDEPELGGERPGHHAAARAAKAQLLSATENIDDDDVTQVRYQEPFGELQETGRTWSAALSGGRRQRVQAGEEARHQRCRASSGAMSRLARYRVVGCGFEQDGSGGGGGNRTRVLRRTTRASPSAVRCASARPHRSHGRVGVTGPVAVRCPARARDRRAR